MSAKLVAEIDADTRGFEAGVNRMEEISEKFAHKVTHHFERAFGIGFLASKAVEMVKGIFERAEEITKLADETGRTVEEVQLLQAAAEEAGTSFEEYMRRAKEGIIDLHAELARMRERKGLVIIGADEVENLKEANNAIKMTWNYLQNMLAGSVGNYLLAGKALYNLRPGEAFKRVVRGEIYSQANLSFGGLKESLDRSLQGTRGQTGFMWTPLINPLLLLDYKYAQGLKKRLGNLTGAQTQLEAENRPWHWMNAGSLPIGMPGMSMFRVQDPEKIPTLLEEVRDQIKEVKTELEKVNKRLEPGGGGS